MAHGFGLRKKEAFIEDAKTPKVSVAMPSQKQQQLPFALANPGETVDVVQVKGKDETRRFLAQLGFVEGAKVSIVSENGGNIIASVKDSRVAISQAMAMRIMVV